MNILFISIAWPSPGNRNLYTDLMDEFVAHGHQISAVGVKDNDKNSKYKLTNERGIKVLRVYSGKVRKTSYLEKIKNLIFLGKRIESAVIKSFEGEKFDLIIGPTPSITLSGMYKRLKKKYNASFYLLLKDIWPQGSVDLKVFKKYSLPWLYFRDHEVRIYKTADFIGCMSPKGVEYVLANNKFLSPGKVEVCPNSIKPKEIILQHDTLTIRKKYSIPSDACVFLFSGNLGVGHGLHFIIEVAKKLIDYPDAYFIIGGSGTQYEYLEKTLNEFPLPNIMLYSWLPVEDYEQIVATSDVGLIFLYRYTSPQFPSRLLSYLEHSKPVLCAINKETDIGTIVEKAGCGKSVLHGETDKFIEAVKFFSENIELRNEMGKKGRKLLMENYTVKHSYNIIMKHFVK